MPPLPRLAFNGFPQLAFSPPVLSAAGHPPLQGALCWNWSLGGHWTSPVSKSSCSISPLSNPFLASLASQCHWCHPVTVKTISNHIGLKVNNMTRKSKLCCTLNIKGRTQCERNNASWHLSSVLSQDLGQHQIVKVCWCLTILNTIWIVNRNSEPGFAYMCAKLIVQSPPPQKKSHCSH